MSNLNQPSNIAFLFIGSEVQPTDSNTRLKKILRKMPGSEYNLYSSYISKEELLFPVLIDGLKCKTMLKEKCSHFDQLIFHHQLEFGRQDFIDRITSLFNSKFNGTIIIFSGDAIPENGNWVLENNKSVESIQHSIRFEDILRAWKRRCSTQKHLLLIIDSNYSGHWINKLKNLGEFSISIQTSSTHLQQSYVDSKIGSFFLHNLFKIVCSRTSERILEELFIKQTPCFYGDFHEVYRTFGLKLKLESYEDMRKALSNESHGDWPRIFKHLKTWHSKLPLDKQITINWDSLPAYIDSNNQKYEGNIDREGNKEGFGVLYFSNNVPEFKGHFQNDFKHGKGAFFDRSGKILFEGSFQNGQQIGHGRLYDIEASKFIEGNAIEFVISGDVCEYDLQGNLIFHGSYLNNRRNGLGVDFYSSQKIKMQANWIDGKAEGFVHEFNQNGTPLYNGYYKNGLRSGTGELFYENGNLKYIGGFENGLFSGLGKAYSFTGEVICEGEFQSGHLTGMAVAHIRSGKVIWKGVFQDKLESTLTSSQKEKMLKHFKNITSSVKSKNSSISTHSKGDLVMKLLELKNKDSHTQFFPINTTEFRKNRSISANIVEPKKRKSRNSLKYPNLDQNLLLSSPNPTHHLRKMSFLRISENLFEQNFSNEKKRNENGFKNTETLVEDADENKTITNLAINEELAEEKQNILMTQVGNEDNRINLEPNELNHLNRVYDKNSNFFKEFLSEKNIIYNYEPILEKDLKNKNTSDQKTTSNAKFTQESPSNPESPSVDKTKNLKNDDKKVDINFKPKELIKFSPVKADLQKVDGSFFFENSFCALNSGKKEEKHQESQQITQKSSISDIKMGEDNTSKHSLVQRNKSQFLKKKLIVIKNFEGKQYLRDSRTKSVDITNTSSNDLSRKDKKNENKNLPTKPKPHFLKIVISEGKQVKTVRFS